MKLKDLLVYLSESEQINQLSIAILELDDSLNESELLYEFSLEGLKTKLKNKIITALGGIVPEEVDTPEEKKEASTPEAKAALKKANDILKTVTTAKLDAKDIQALMKKAKTGKISTADIRALQDSGSISNSDAGKAKHMAGKRERGVEGKAKEDVKKEEKANLAASVQELSLEANKRIPGAVEKLFRDVGITGATVGVANFTPSNGMKDGNLDYSPEGIDGRFSIRVKYKDKNIILKGDIEEAGRRGAITTLDLAPFQYADFDAANDGLRFDYMV